MHSAQISISITHTYIHHIQTIITWTQYTNSAECAFLWWNDFKTKREKKLLTKKNGRKIQNSLCSVLHFCISYYLSIIHLSLIFDNYPLMWTRTCVSFAYFCISFLKCIFNKNECIKRITTIYLKSFFFLKKRKT